MTDISTLSQRLTTPTLHFVLLTVATCGIWPLLSSEPKTDGEPDDKQIAANRISGGVADNLLFSVQPQ